MIIVIGDVHGHFGRLRDLVRRLVAKYGPQITIIQVGDLGWWSDVVLAKERKAMVSPGYRVLWVPGNHEDYRDLLAFTVPTEIPRANAEGLIFMPRGTVQQIDGLSVGFLGGADSIDKATRVEGVSWFPEERVTYSDIMRFAEVPYLDLLITHTPPQGLLRHVWDVSGDSSSQAVQQLWDGLGRPSMACGHMHDTVLSLGVMTLGELDAAIFTHERKWRLVPREVVGQAAEIARSRFEPDES